MTEAGRIVSIARGWVQPDCIIEGSNSVEIIIGQEYVAHTMVAQRLLKQIGGTARKHVAVGTAGNVHGYKTQVGNIKVYIH